jgi:hypothetical protein
MSGVWRVTRAILKWSGIAVLSMIALAVALFAVAYVINAHDEALAPETRALLVPPPNPYKPEDNLYFALQGFDAPPGESVIAAGQARIESYDRRIETVLHDSSGQVVEALTRASDDPRRLKFNGDCALLQPLNSSVWSEVPKHRAELDKLWTENSELYARYLALHALHGYYETARPSYLTPFWGTNCERQIFLAQVVLRIRSGDPERQRALADLESDVQMWRAVFNGEGALVSKLVSAAYVQGDYLLLADVISDPNVVLPMGEKDGDSLVPVFDLRDWDVGKAFGPEFRVSSFILEQTEEMAKTGARSVDGHFFKFNATENLYARRAMRRMEDARDPARFLRVKDEPVADFPVDGWGMYTMWLGYNPIGKFLAWINEPVYSESPARVWDAAAVQRLVRLSYEIRRQRIDAAGIPAFMKQHPEWSTHPADGRPFLWDAGTEELRVQTVGKQAPGRRFSIRVWQAASAAG